MTRPLPSGLGPAMSAEWTKIASLRSMLGVLGAFVTVSVGMALALGIYHGQNAAAMSAQARDAFDPVATGLGGVRIGLLALVVFGVIAVTSEFSSGTIQSSVLAVPQRDLFFTAKVTTTALSAAAVSTVAVGVSFIGAQLALGDELGLRVVDATGARAVVAAVAYTTLLCLFSLGVAMVLRSAVATLSILLPLFLTVSTILTNVPGVQGVAVYLPDIAGAVALSGRAAPDAPMTPLTGMAVLVAWTGAALVAGYLSFRRRDLS